MAVDNIQYKDRLFNFIFGSEENKAWTLSLYNAVNGSSYTDPTAIEINTIKEVMYLGMHNDVSFLIADNMNLYEQQSTYNPNMPLRFLQYAGNLLGTKVVLVDGGALTRLMIKHNVGVSIEHVYEVKRLDSDFFADEL